MFVTLLALAPGCAAQPGAIIDQAVPSKGALVAIAEVDEDSKLTGSKGVYCWTDRTGLMKFIPDPPNWLVPNGCLGLVINRDSSPISTRLSRDLTLCLSGVRLRLAVFDGF